MTLYKLIKELKTLFYTEPNIGSVYDGDVYKLSEMEAVVYPAIVITQGSHNIDNSRGIENYTFTFFGIDRLTDDGSNLNDVQSWANDIITSIAGKIESTRLGIVDGNYTVVPFTERFTDECGGAYSTMTIQVGIDSCNRFNFVTSVNGMTGDVLLDLSNGFLSYLSDYTTYSYVDSVYAKKSQLPDVSNYVTYTYLNEVIESIEPNDVDLSEYAKLSDLSSYVKTSELDQYVKDNELEQYAKKSELPDLSSYVTSDELSQYVKVSELNQYAKLTDIPNVSNYVTYTYLNDVIENIETGDVDLSEYAKLSDLSSYVKTSELDQYVKSSELNQYAKKSELPDVSNYVTYTYLNDVIENIETGDVDLSEYVTNNQLSSLPAYGITTADINRWNSGTGGSTYEGPEHVEITQAEYDALSYEEQTNGTIYFITDWEAYSKAETVSKINELIAYNNSYISSYFPTDYVTSDDLDNYVTNTYLNEVIENLEVGDIDLSNYVTYTGDTIDSQFNITWSQITNNPIDPGDIESFRWASNQISVIQSQPFYAITSSDISRWNNAATGGEIDLSDYAKLTDIPDVSNYITSNELNNYVTYTYLSDVIDGLGTSDIDLSSYVTNSRLEALPSYSITSEDINRWNSAATGGEIDLSDYAKLTDLPDLSSYVKTSTLNQYAKLTDLPNLSDYMTIAYANSHFVKTSRLTDYVKKTDLNSLIDEEDPTVPNFVKSITQADINRWNNAAGGGNVDLSDYAKLSDLSSYALKTEIPDVSDLPSYSYVNDKFALKTEIPDVSNLPSYSYVNGKFALKTDVTKHEEVTLAEYNALSSSEKNNGTVYLIKDWETYSKQQIDAKLGDIAALLDKIIEG